MNLSGVHLDPNQIFIDPAQTIELAKRIEGRDAFDASINLIKIITQVALSIIITIPLSIAPIVIGFSGTVTFLTIGAIFAIANFAMHALIDLIDRQYQYPSFDYAKRVIRNHLEERRAAQGRA